jgi:hypothetical protein
VSATIGATISTSIRSRELGSTGHADPLTFLDPRQPRLHYAAD